MNTGKTNQSWPCEAKGRKKEGKYHYREASKRRGDKKRKQQRKERGRK
jgi:hypothetical protein